MMKVANANCPICGSRNTLQVDTRYVIDREQINGDTVVARIKPLLSCMDCDLLSYGDFTDDGYTVSFGGLGGPAVQQEAQSPTG